MVYFRTHNDGFICDMCKKSFPVDVDMKGCRTCDFDTCKECYKGKVWFLLATKCCCSLTAA